MCRRRTIERVAKLTVLVSIMAAGVLYFTKAGKSPFLENSVRKGRIGKFRTILELFRTCKIRNYQFDNKTGKYSLLKLRFDLIMQKLHEHVAHLYNYFLLITSSSPKCSGVTCLKEGEARQSKRLKILDSSTPIS